MTRLSKADLEGYCKRNGIDYDKLLKQATPVKAVGITVALQEDDKRNETEKLFERDNLVPWKLAGVVIEYRVEPLNFRIGKGKCFYKPDYLAVTDEGRLQIHEVKGGFIREDAHIKFRVASLLYPWFEWHLWQWENDMWQCIEKH